MDIPCICPPNAKGEPRHVHDKVVFREQLGFRDMLAAQKTWQVMKSEDPDVSTGEILAGLTEFYLLAGIESWTLVDAKNKPVEVTKPAIREHLLTRFEIALELASEADRLYFETVISPLVQAASSSSPTTPTEVSTSATPGSSPNPKPSRRSSTSTTPMDGIGGTPQLPGGGSSLSPS